MPLREKQGKYININGNFSSYPFVYSLGYHYVLCHPFTDTTIQCNVIGFKLSLKLWKEIVVVKIFQRSKRMSKTSVLLREVIKISFWKYDYSAGHIY